MKSKRKLNWAVLTWLVLAIASIIFYITATGFVAFPEKFKMPLLIGLAAVNAILGILCFFTQKAGTLKSVVNVVLALALGAGSVYIPHLETQMKNVFTEAPVTDEVAINVYAFTTEYKEAHPDIMKASSQVVTSENIADYSHCSFITQTATEVEDQAFALAQLHNVLDVDSIWTIEKEDMWAALEAFYAGEGELLILNSAYIPSIKEVSGYETFDTDTVAIYTVNKEITAQEDMIPVVDKDITNTPFTVFIGGSDSRSRMLSQYGRTDVDILVTVDPVNFQVMLVSFPRDAYIPNPSLGNGLDKLTHLGNAGAYNTMKGLSNVLNVPVEHYAIVNFATFQIIVDAIGGIDLYNPYTFNAGHDAGYGYFPEGDIHLNGSEALVYVRERQNLPNGDYGRNEHQVIALKAILSKVTSPSILGSINDILSALEGQFLTSINPEDIYKLAGATLDSDSGWEIISYHMGGIGQYAQTASMPGRELYVAELMQSQVDFISEQINMMLNGEDISQQEMPDEDNTVYLPN